MSDLRQKIDEAKRRLPLPELMAREGLSEHAKKSAPCPFLGHEDKRPSFSVFKGADGWWHWKCFAACGEGDEIAFLSKLNGLSRTEAISLYLQMAGFPPSRPPKSHECRKSLGSPKCLESPKYHESLMYPMSNGQGLNGQTEKVLKTLAAQNACTEPNTARKRRFKLVRDLKAIEKGIGRERRPRT
jgi:DNA primase